MKVIGQKFVSVDFYLITVISEKILHCIYHFGFITCPPVKLKIFSSAGLLKLLGGNNH